MIKITDTYATVWQPESKGKYTQANLSTGKKDKDGNWTNMSWRAKFVGKNQDVTEKQRIKITSGSVENRKYEDKFYTDVIVFEWEPIEKKDTQPTFAQLEQEGEDSLPF